MFNTKYSITILASITALVVFLALAFVGIIKDSPVFAGLVSGALIALIIKLASNRIERLENGK